MLLFIVILEVVVGLDGIAYHSFAPLNLTLQLAFLFAISIERSNIVQDPWPLHIISSRRLALLPIHSAGRVAHRKLWRQQNSFQFITCKIFRWYCRFTSYRLLCGTSFNGKVSHLNVEQIKKPTMLLLNSFPKCSKYSATGEKECAFSQFTIFVVVGNT